MIDATGAASALAGGQLSSTAQAEAKLAENFDTFLNLLTTQLRNQDPLDPMDSAQFTEQLVQFSQVEQAILSNKNLEQLIYDVRTGQNAAFLNYLGEEIEAVGDTTMLSNGVAKWSYTLPANAERAEYAIADSEGKVVAFGHAQREAGTHIFTWDGKSNSGVVQPDGAYTLVISAFDKKDGRLQVESTILGAVTGVETNGGKTSLAMGDVLIAIDDVLGVRKATPAPQSDS